MARNRLLVFAVTAVMTLCLALGCSGCSKPPAAPPVSSGNPPASGDKTTPPASTTPPPSGTATPPPASTNPPASASTGGLPAGKGNPGDGLPVEIESGLLAFGMRTWVSPPGYSRAVFATLGRDGKDLTERFFVRDEGLYSRISPDGKKVATYYYEGGFPSLVVYGLETKTVTELKLEKFGFMDNEPLFLWSSDSLYITCSCLKDDEYHLVRLAADGSSAVSVTTEPVSGELGYMAAVPGKNQVLFAGDVVGKTPLYRYDFDANAVSKVGTLDPSATRLNMSADGRYLAYWAGTYQDSIVTVGGTEAVQVFDLSSGKQTSTQDVKDDQGGLISPHCMVWSPKDNVLAILRDKDNETCTIAFYKMGEDGISVRTGDLPKTGPFSAMVWDAGGEALYFVTGEIRAEADANRKYPQAIYKVDPSDGTATRIFTSVPGARIEGLCITP